MLFLEEAFRGLAPITGYATGLTAAQTYLRWGSEEQKRTIVASLRHGGQVRRALAPPIYGGANEIQREIIGKSLGL